MTEGTWTKPMWSFVGRAGDITVRSDQGRTPSLSVVQYDAEGMPFITQYLGQKRVLERKPPPLAL